MRSLWRMQRWIGAFAEDGVDRLAEGFGAVDHEQDPLGRVETALDEIAQERGRDGGVLGASFPEPERDLDAVGGDPERDDVGAALEVDPVEHHHREPDVVEAAGHQLAERLPGPLHERPRHRRLARRPGRLLDRGADRLQHPHVAAGRDAGEHPLEHQPSQRVTVGEVRVRLQRELLRPVGAPHPRPLDTDAAAAEGHLASLVPMPHRPPGRIVSALRADNLVDLLLHQLGQHTQGRHPRSTRAVLPSQHPRARRAPPAHAPATRSPRRSRPARPLRSPSRRFLLRSLVGSPRTLPAGADEAEGPPSSSTSYGTTSAAWFV